MYGSLFFLFLKTGVGYASTWRQSRIEDGLLGSVSVFQTLNISLTPSHQSISSAEDAWLFNCHLINHPAKLSIPQLHNCTGGREDNKKKIFDIIDYTFQIQVALQFNQSLTVETVLRIDSDQISFLLAQCTA